MALVSPKTLMGTRRDAMTRGRILHRVAVDGPFGGRAPSLLDEPGRLAAAMGEPAGLEALPTSPLTLDVVESGSSLPSSTIGPAQAPELLVDTGPLPAERVGPLSVQDEQRLARRWRMQEDQEALRRLVQAHLGLVIRIAREFRHSGPSMDDLIQEGNLGLTIAAQRFDPTRATRLSTFATYWIRACMMEHVVRSHGPVRIGTTRAQRKIFFGLSRARRKLESNGTPADIEALAGVLGVEPADVESMVPRLSGRDIALDAPRGSDDERPSSALLADASPTPEEMVAGVEEDDARRSLLREALKVLDNRERTIIRARHMSQRPATLAALGKKFNISRERVRQLELRAVNKLRQRCGIPLGGVMPEHGADDEAN